MKLKRVFLSLTLALAIVFIIGTGTLEAATLTVCPAGPPTCDYSSIQDAIDDASSADTVEVRAGTYNENITMKDGVDVVNNPGDTPVIDGGETDSVVTFSGALSNGSTLDGFDIKNAGSNPGIYVQGTGAGITNSTTIKDCLIHGNSGPGIKVDGNGTNTTAPIIDNNEIYGNTEEGIYILNGGSASEDAVILNNTIRENTLAGINIGGASYVTVGEDNIVRDNYAGIAFDTGAPTSSRPVEIIGNDIFSNDEGGISLKDAITGEVTITQNDIHENTKGGIGIQNSCELVITENDIYENFRGGIHTGTDVADPGGFGGSPGSADLNIRKNKVHNNGRSGYGGGIDVRHAEGIIYNNLAYRNHRVGIRFGDWIDEIINNTVVNNGQNDSGGGIIYDDIYASGSVNDPPEGYPPVPLPIRNNISAYNEKAGVRACFTNTENSEERDYNLFYGNYRWSSVHGWYNDPDCGWPPGFTVLSCPNQQYGGCGVQLGDSGWELTDPHDKMANPLFVYDCLTDDNTTTGNTPGGGTYILFDLHRGYPETATTYEITDVRLYGSATTYTWDVYVGNNPSGCTGAWGTQVYDDWVVGGTTAWYETSVTKTSGRYIKLVTTADIDENTIFEFDYKSTQTGGDWQTPVMVVYECTDIAQDNYELLSGSPAIDSGDPDSSYNDEDSSRNDMGAYGGPDPIDW